MNPSTTPLFLFSPSYGKIGYEAYVASIQESVGPVPFYDWKELPPKVQAAWETGCDAVAARVRAEQKEEGK